MRASAKTSDDGWLANGEKAWVTHGGHADFYSTFLRTPDDGERGISTFHLTPDLPGFSAARPEEKMGLTGSTTAAIRLDDVPVPADRLVGERGRGLSIALAALDSGRLGVSAVAVGLAQSALDVAVRYAGEREAFGRPIVEHQGVAFLLADMAAAVESARATYLVAARRKDAGKEYSRQASIAKLVATDAAMKVTTDAVQVLGGAGYTREFPVERYMREAKVMQIFEGTNQIQRMVIGKSLAREAAPAGAEAPVRRRRVQHPAWPPSPTSRPRSRSSPPGCARSFDAHGHKFLATLRADGSPADQRHRDAASSPGSRGWPACPESVKFADLRRDPRFALHSGSSEPDAFDADAKLSGRATEVTEPEERSRYAAAAGHPRGAHGLRPVPRRARPGRARSP